MSGIRFAYLGRTDYHACWKLQESLFRERFQGHIPDTLLLTEHNPVYTIGRNGTDLHLLAGEEELRRRGITVVRNDRGGDITYHGPGQLVGYPILDLHGYYLDLHRYLRDIEEVIIQALALYGIRGERIPEYTGVWVEGEKICAIGIKCSRWVTMHGFALNVSSDLTPFDRIIPCGIFERGVTSMEKRIGEAIPLDNVAEGVATSFGKVFGRTMDGLPAGEMLHMAEHNIAEVQ